MYCGNEKNLEVHHIQPFHLQPELELDQSNLITLCEAIGADCHLRQGHLGNWKGCNPNIRQVCADQQLSNWTKNNLTPNGKA